MSHEAQPVTAAATTTTTTTTTTPGPARERLSGHLGVAAIVLMVIAAAAPLTVIGGNVPLAVGAGNGIGAPVGFLAATVVLLVFSVGFVTMTPHVTEAGAFFSYVTAGLGSRLGLGSAFVALVAYTAIQVGVYGYAGWAADDIVGHFGGPELPWWLYSYALLVVVALLGYRHIELGAAVLAVALVLEIAVMLVLDVSIFATGGAGGAGPVWSSFSPDEALQAGFGVAVLFALTGFIGFEATAVFRDEAKDPERTVPRATYLAVVIIGVFYCVSCWALVTGAGAADAVSVAQATLAGDGNMMLDMGQTYVGEVFRDVMNVLLLSSLFACVLSFHNVLARYQFTLAHKGVLPAPLGRRNARHRAPSVASAVQTVTAAVVLGFLALAGLDPLVGVFGSMAGVSTVGMVLLMLVTSAAVIVFFARRPGLARGRRGRTLVAPVVAIVGLLACLWLVLSNFTLVTGASAAVSAVLALIPVAAGVLGVALGGRFSLAAAEDDGAAASPAPQPT